MDRGPIVIAALLLAATEAAAVQAASVDLVLTQRDGAPLADAVVSAIPLDGRALPTPARAVMDQRQRKFVPQILPVQTHATVHFPNSDSVTHHVYSFSAAKRFALYLSKGQPGKDVVFDAPGVVTLGCNLHDWMLGYIVVLDTPYFAQTAADGRATLANLPAGRYRLQVWHPRITDPAASLAHEQELAITDRSEWTLRLAQAVLPARDQKPGVGVY
jgi:plastocyanin